MRIDTLVRYSFFMVAAMVFCLLPSRSFASREETINATLDSLESKEGPSDTAGKADLTNTVISKSLPQNRDSGGSPASVEAPSFAKASLPTQPVRDDASTTLNKYQKMKEAGDRQNPFRTKAIPAENKYVAEGLFYISGGYDTNHIHYKEVAEKQTFDEDYGNLQGFYVNIGFRSGRYLPRIQGMPFVEAYYRRHDDLITYDGASGLGPLSFDERAEIHRYGIKVGAFWDYPEKTELFAYLDLGRRIWYRGENETIQGVLTYAEKYWWEYLGLGGGINYRLFSKLTCGAELEAMGALNAKMRADLYEGGTFRLGGVAGWEVKLPIKYYLWKNFSLDVTPYFTAWNISHSDDVKISGSYYYEPDSHTYIEGVLLGATCRL